MKVVEKRARTVEDAVAAVLVELGVSRKDVEVEVIEEGTRGLFGLLGGRDAHVRVKLKEAPPEEKVGLARAFLEGLLRRMGVRAAVESRLDDEGTVYINVTGENLGRIIGRRGQTLDAIQYLVGVVANRKEGPFTRIVLDAEGYRRRREESLRQLARRMAERAKRQGRKTVLEPMSAMDRRVVHLALAEDDGIETHSEGQEPHRRVVIVPKT